MSNLTSLCSAHHDLLHRGKLVIEGTAPDLAFFRITDDELQTALVPRGMTGTFGRGAEGNST